MKYLILFALLALTHSKVLDPSKITFAVNCGHEGTMKSAGGYLYIKDQGYSPNSKVSDYFLNPDLAKIPIKYTYDEAVYKTERHGDDSFYYDVQIKKDGMYFTIPGKRVFNIKLGETRVLRNVDVVGKVGPYAAYDEYIEFEVKDNKAYFNGQLCDNAFDTVNRKIKVVFEKTDRDLPKVEGIILFEGPKSETDYEDQESMRKEWDARVEEEKRIQEEERRKKIENKKKVLEALQEDEEYFNVNETTIEGIQRVLLGKEGAAIIGALASFFVLLAIFVNEKELQVHSSLIQEYERKKSL